MPHIFFSLVPKPSEGVQLLYINLPKGGVLNNFTTKIKLKIKKNRTSFSFGQQVLFFFDRLGRQYIHQSWTLLMHTIKSVPRKGNKKLKDCLSEVDTGAL